MPGRIPQAFIDELLARTDIVEVLGGKIALKKAGREWKACCPFHAEKTPSFTVSQQKQFYHCFGCGAHGTALSFLMEHDRLSFPEAVEDLAGRAGLEVPKEAGAVRADRGLDDLYALMSEADQHFREELKGSATAKTYLQGRGLVGETATRYHIGYAPPGWDSLLRKFGATEAGRAALLACGLIIERDEKSAARSGHYDRFRDRIMFPIRDARGRVVGFGGRVIGAGEPKYLNSPETPLFHKGRELYGLYEARTEQRQLTRLLVVEGYMDVVRLAQAGIHYAVATLGTATTPEHLNRLFRLCNDIVFAFDGDRAGRQAAWRALETSLPQAREGRQIKFLFLPEGHDPDTLVAEEGREAFEARIDGATPLSEYLVGHLTAEVDLNHVDGRARLAELARPLLARLPAGVYRELLLERLAREVRLPATRLARLLGLEDTGTPGGFAAPAPETPGRTRARAGRGTLLRQAIARVLQMPAAARAVPDTAPLRDSGDRGLAVLGELIDAARTEPLLTTAQLVERWRERPEHERLAELAGLPCPELDARGAGDELAGAVAKLLAGHGPERRVNELIEKAAAQLLSEAEKAELRELQGRFHARG
jgi:DNA primase